MSRNSHRSFQPERFRSVLIFMLLIAMTLTYMLLSRPAAAVLRKTALERTDLPNEKIAGASTQNVAKLPAGATASGFVTPAAQAQASPTPTYGGIIFGHGYFNSVGMNKANPDGTNRVNLTDIGSIQATGYSVSRDTGMIAFQVPSGDHGSKIFVMNSDGSGLRQISPGTDPSDTTQDFNASISPDGSKVAFGSTRRRGEQVAICSDPSATVLRRDYEIWMVNTDGTNFHQVTFSEDHFVATGIVGDGCGVGSTTRVAWMADSQHLVVYGTRPFRKQSGDLRLFFPAALEAWSPTGRFGTLYGVDPNSDPVNRDQSADDPRKQAVGAVGGSEWLDVDPNNRVLFHAGCCFIPNVDGLGFWTPGTLGVSYQNRDVVMGKDTSIGETGSIALAKYSPDGSHIAMWGTSPFFNQNHQATIFVDGYQGLVPGVAGFANFTFGLAWAPGPAIPKPDKLVLQPSPLWLYNGVRSPVSPALLDADGNVIARIATWNSSDVCPTCGFRCDNTPDQIPCSGPQLNTLSVDFNGSVLGSGANAQGNLCEANAGFRACVPYYNTAGSAFISAAASQPIAFTSGAGGPGKFTISRVGTPLVTTAVLINFTIGGTAQRDVDYTLDFSGNQIILPSGQASIDINVRPLRSQPLDKTVIFTLQTSNGNYSIVNASATVTIKDPAPTPTPSPSPTPSITLSYISPNKGGDAGSVTTAVFGTNIQSGAAVKLVRTGQPDILGTGTAANANGLSITTTFDLNANAQGAWDVVVTNPNSQTATLAGAFTIEPSQGADVWVDIIGRYTMRSGLTQTFYIVYGNRGDVDAAPTMFRVYIPSGITVTKLRPLPNGSTPFLLSQDDGTVLEFHVDKLAASSSTFLPIDLTADPALAHQTFKMRAWSVSSPALSAIAGIQPDPTATFTSDILDQTTNHLKMVIHINGASGSEDIVNEVTLTPDTQARPPTMNKIETTDELEYVYEVSIPSSEVGPLNGKVAGISDTTHLKISPADNLEYTKISNAVRIAKISQGLLILPPVGIETFRVEIERKQILQCFSAVFKLPLEKQKLLEAWAEGVSVLTLVRIGANDTHRGDIHLYPYLDDFEHLLLDVLVAKSTDPTIAIVARENRKDLIYEWLIKHCFCSELGKIPIDSTDRFSTRETSASCPFCPSAAIQNSEQKCKTCEQTSEIIVLFAFDPNDKVGSQGAGAQHFINGEEPVRYAVFFENLATATAPAQTVVVTDQLDASTLDLSTFNFNAFGFGSTQVGIQSGFSNYATDIDLRPANNLIARVNAQLNKNTGLLTCTFSSIDPATGLPTANPLAGFLPPDKNAPEGQGSVVFTVMPKPNLPTGTEIRNKARIVFDNNAPIDTAEWLNTIDNTKPASHISALDAIQPFVIFNVSWNATDTGAGIRDFTVYVSENGGPYTIWLNQTTLTSAYFIGQPGKNYLFYSIATDQANNQEAAKTTAEAATTTRSDITNAIDDARFFIRQQYLDFLNRLPEPSCAPDKCGFDFYVPIIQGCGTDIECFKYTRGALSANFFRSPEFGQKGGYVANLFNIVIGQRPKTVAELSDSTKVERPHYAEFTADLATLSAATDADTNLRKDQLAASWLGRTEVQAILPSALTNQQFVQKLESIAGVTLANESTLIANLNNNTQTRAQVLRAIAESSEVTTKFYKQNFVTMEYLGYLRRDPEDCHLSPDPANCGYIFHNNRFNTPGVNADLIENIIVRGFIESPEYRGRFGP